jgi:hypothetical protein
VRSAPPAAGDAAQEASGRTTTLVSLGGCECGLQCLPDRPVEDLLPGRFPDDLMLPPPGRLPDYRGFVKRPRSVVTLQWPPITVGICASVHET